MFIKHYFIQKKLNLIVSNFKLKIRKPNNFFFEMQIY